jgi:hypothetical protein
MSIMSIARAPPGLAAPAGNLERPFVVAMLRIIARMSSCRLAVSALALLGAFYYFVDWLLVGGSWPQGWATLAILVLLSIGLNALLLGIQGAYIGRIFKNVKALPLVIIEDVIDHGGAAARDEPSKTGRPDA